MGAPCGDGGPWLCFEAGCPSPAVDCATLARSCSVRFDDIWTTLPEARLRGRRVRDACRNTCGECASHCELLSRDVLTAADASTGTHAVHLLRFALPHGSRVSGPTAHVKVQAPDEAGQLNRVRAYSMLLDEKAPTFNLTVKIYPGGPPATRGTSAFLGALPLGHTLHVPETRAIDWARSPSAAMRVGLVAFGVGIAECVEPVERLLAEGAEVRLLTASRHEGQLLYRERLHGLLASHSGHFTVRHCLSRGAGDTDSAGRAGGVGSIALAPTDAAQSNPPVDCPTCVPGERIIHGRIDEGVVREAFGDWAALVAAARTGAASAALASDSAATAGGALEPTVHFLVVGTGRMEHECWAWLQSALGVHPRRHSLLAGSAGWRPLVPEPLRSCAARR